MNLYQQPFNRNTNRRNSRCCSYFKARTKPKARTGTNCVFNAREQDKQHIELQKRHPDLPEQAPPHESAPAALQQKHQQKEQQMLLIPQGPDETQSRNRHQPDFFNAQEQDKQHIEFQTQHPDLPEQAPPHESAPAALQQKHQQKEQHMLLIFKARTKPKARTGTNCNLNAQEQDEQHIELQKQHPDLPEQAPPHEIAPAALQQKHQQKEQQMLLIPQGPNETQSRNRQQLQFKCAGTRQAAHRIAETASRPARAGTST